METSAAKSYADLFIRALREELTGKDGRCRQDSLSQIKSFLDASDSEIVSDEVGEFYKFWDGLLYSLHYFIKDSGGEMVIRSFVDSSGREESCTYRLIQTSADEKIPVLSVGVIFLKIKNNSVAIMLGSDVTLTGNSIGRDWINFFFRKSDQAFRQKFMDEFYQAQVRHSIYKNQCLRIDERSVEFLKRENLAWSDIFLPSSVIDELKKNAISFIEQKATWDKMGLPARRSILISGKPGTGKTMIGRLLASILDEITFIWTTPSGLSSVGIDELYKFARKHTPAILFLEDLDLSATYRYSDIKSVLGELLCEMDGFFSNKDILTIATTNNPEALDEAIADRPGRFDRHIQLGYPDSDIRLKMISSWLANDSIVDREKTIQILVDITKGMTGAHIRELIYSAKIEALAQSKSDKHPIALQIEHFHTARNLLTKSKGFLGFDSSK